MKGKDIYILGCLLAICLLPMASWAQDLQHFEGTAANKGFNWNGTQKSHEFTYYLYVKPGESVDLDLPLENYNGNGQNTEPRGYFRWYNWSTDGMDSHLSTYSGTRLTSFSNGKGYYTTADRLNGDQAKRSNVGVKYTAPSGTDYDDWTVDTIACDESRYTNYVTSGNTFREPTLSIRFKFVIRKASWMADELKTALITAATDRRTAEDGKYMDIGIRGVDSGDSKAYLRYNYADIENYYFYPLTKEALYNKKVYYPVSQTEQNRFKDSDFTTELVKATNSVWYVYDETFQYWCTLTPETGKPYFCIVSPYLLNNATWTNINTKQTGKPGSLSGLSTFGANSRFYVASYLQGGTDQYCPIFNVGCRFVSDYPRSLDDLSTNAPMRTIDYIEDHYKRATDPISFDNTSEGMTLDLPTKENNIAKNPSAWNLRHYGFVYSDLGLGAVTWGIGKNAPLHGEYGLYKSAGVSGISTNSQGYQWWCGPSNFYDRTYYRTNGAQSGYFLYVDASDESRPIASADFDAKLCTGSTFIVSAAVADLTSGGIRPQVLFKLYGLDADGTTKQENLLHTFHSADFATVGATDKAKWYQVYGKVTLRKNSHVENFSKFRVTIDNYCPGTQGADYAIDDLRFYTMGAWVQVIQSKPLCDDAKSSDNMTFKLRTVHESLSSRVEADKDGKAKIYYRFVDENYNPVDMDYDNGDKKYGVVDFNTDISKCGSGDQAGQVELANNEHYFVIANRKFNLEAGKNYYVVLAFEDPEDASTEWGNPLNTCSAYSEKFSMVKQSVVLKDDNTNVLSEYHVGCQTGDAAQIELNANLQTTDPNMGGSITLKGVPFDWYFGTKDDFNATTGLLEALQALRDKTHDAITNINQLSGYGLDSKYVTVLQNNWDKLSLAASSTLSHNFAVGQKHTLCMIPISDAYNKVTVNGVTYEVCPDPIEYSFGVYREGPKIDLGFYNVTYAKDYERAVRLGLPQLKNLKAKDGILYLPINKTLKIHGVNTSDNVNFLFNGVDMGTHVILSGTNDPSLQDEVSKGTVYFELQSNTLLHQDKETSQRELGLKLSDGVGANLTKYFHEGYYYELRFDYIQQSKTASWGDNQDYTTCPGSTYFIVKVVPEYTTWTPTADNGMNNNWNNDLNWCRSSKKDLYKEGTDYPVYGETDGYQGLTVQQSYVPMKFTKVTILGPQYTIGYYPLMGYLQKNTTTGLLDKLTNGASTATDNIQYDLMMDEAGMMPSGDNENNYGCLPFYGNTCEQLYFKPEAEIRNQQYLVYNKAWVEKELNLRQRYILGTPLKETYSGDLYVPKTNGRQETEAFEDITYDADRNDRYKYPFIQRGWNDSEAKEITPDGSSWKAYDYVDYSISMPDELNWQSLNWSHPYNDVTVKYSPEVNSDGSWSNLKGFSIQAGEKYTPTGNDGKVLLRLPKADTSYSYTDVDGTVTEQKTITRTADNYKLIIASANPTDRQNENAVAPVVVQLSDDGHAQKSKDGYYYYLTYNPYMATLDMKSFFANKNNQEELGVENTSYWVVKDGTTESGNNAALAGETDGRIAPMEAFFLKSKKQNPTIRFTSQMTVDKTVNRGVATQAESQNARLTFDVQSASGRSTSYVVENAHASADYDSEEDTEILYGGGEAPMLYTVAGSQAVAVNTLPSIDWVPMGIISEDSSAVTIAVKGLKALSTPLYLYDAEVKQYQELQEGVRVAVKTNAHGRYFLTQTRSTTSIDEAENGEESVKIYSPTNGVIVISSFASPLRQVEVYALDGKQVMSKRFDSETSTSLHVPSSVYIVKVQTGKTSTAITRKLAVR